jgi:hypothetical protein
LKLPERVDKDLSELLRKLKAATWLVLKASPHGFVFLSVPDNNRWIPNDPNGITWNHFNLTVLDQVDQVDQVGVFPRSS